MISLQARFGLTHISGLVAGVMSVVAMVWIDVRDGRGGVAVSTIFSLPVFYLAFCLSWWEYFRENECTLTSHSVFQVGGGERLLGKITTTSISSLSPEKAMHTNVRLIHRIAFLGISLILFARWHVGLAWGCLGWGRSSCCTSQCKGRGRSFYCTSNHGWMFENHKIISKMLITLAPIKNSLESASLTTCFLQGAFEYLAMIGLCGALVTSAQVNHCSHHLSYFCFCSQRCFLFHVSTNI